MREKTKEEEIATSTKLINDASAAAERLEAATEKYKDLVERQEAVAARMTLGGRSDAGFAEKPREETPREYKDRVMKGGFKEDADKQKEGAR